MASSHALCETDFVPSTSRQTGISWPSEHTGAQFESGSVHPISANWLTEERIAETRRVWSKAYGRVISQQEAIEILNNVRRLAEVLLRSEEESE